MKYGYTYMCILSLLAATVACSSTDETAPADSGQQEIRFSVGDFKSMPTRSALMEGLTDLQMSAILVTAQLSDNHSDAYFEREKLTYANDEWNMNKYYWIPNTNLDFFAYAPYDDPNISNVALIGDNNTFQYKVPSKADEQKDLVFATNYNIYKKDVQLLFKHALSCISFKARTKSAAMHVIVDGISVCNVASQGTFTYPSANTFAGDGIESTAEGAYCEWTLTNSGQELEAGITQTELSNDAEARSITAEGGELLMLPQTLTGGIPDQCYLRIRCKLSDTGLYLAGSADSWGYVYVPLTQKLEQGKKYVYTLEFGIGYNSEGKRNEIRIDLESTITDWNRETMKFDKYIL